MGNKLNIQSTNFDDLYVIEPIVNQDDRGSFFRVFCENELKDILNGKTIKQINHSITSKKGTFRGLHFQYKPNCEVKIVKCIKGKVLDIVVDIRRDSKTFLQTYFIELSEENRKMIYIPEGFAHGFQTLEDNSELLYLHTNIYSPNSEGALNIKDSSLNIQLPLDIIEISKRDEEHDFISSNFKGIEI